MSRLGAHAGDSGRRDARTEPPARLAGAAGRDPGLPDAVGADAAGAGDHGCGCATPGPDAEEAGGTAPPHAVVGLSRWRRPDGEIALGAWWPTPPALDEPAWHTLRPVPMVPESLRPSEASPNGVRAPNAPPMP